MAGRLKPFQTTLAALEAEDPNVALDIDALCISLCDRTWAAATQMLANYPREGVANNSANYPYAYWEGVVASCQGDSIKARAAFTSARAEVQNVVQQQPDFAAALSLLGVIDAGLGKKEEALREGQHASELLPISRDAIDGSSLAINLAQIYTWIGDKDHAVEQIAALERVPNPLSYGLLKLHPDWDPLRGDPRFEKLLEEAKLPVALSALESGVRSAANVAPAPEKSIAVLPFENRSRDPDNAYLAEGIQDEILTRLSKIADLKVISRTSTQHYKSAPTNLPEIARELGVARILEGGVPKAGDASRKSSVGRRADDSHLWAVLSITNCGHKRSPATMPLRRGVGDRHAASWNLFLKDQPDNFNVLGDLALTTMGLGDKGAALALAERARNRRKPESRERRDERTLWDLESSPEWRRGLGRAGPRHRCFTETALGTCAYGHSSAIYSPLCFGQIRCSIRCETIRVFRNSLARLSGPKQIPGLQHRVPGEKHRRFAV